MQDLRYLKWDADPQYTQGAAGTFLKCCTEKYVYKVSAGDVLSGFYGHEAVNEVIVSRLLDMLGIVHTKYTGGYALIKVLNKEFQTFVCKSENFRRSDESKITLETFYSLYGRDNESILECLHRFGFADYVNTLLLVDFLIVNRDRHGANMEILRGTNGLRMSPLFDNGVSFVAPLQNQVDVICNFEPMRDVMCNNFLGTYSVMQNLQYITKPVYVNRLDLKNLNQLFYGFNACLSAVHRNKIIEIIKERYEYARNQKILCEK